MKNFVTCCLLAATLVPSGMHAQEDNFRLVCPLNEATLAPPQKNVIRYNETDFSLALVSISDTVVKAVYKGRITNLEFDEDTRNGVVLYARINNKDYYFWYTGISKPIVHRNETVTAGQALGSILPGTKIELLMYQFETPLDAAKYLDCKCLINGSLKISE